MAARSVATLLPEAAHFPSSSFPQLMLVNRRPVLAFDAATDESAIWSFVAPVGITTPLTAKVHYFMASATSGDVDVDGSVEAITDGDSINLNTTDSFDSVNSTDNTTVPGSTGNPDVISITLTNNDSIAAGDLCRFKLTRDADQDTASGDMYVTAVEIQDDGG
jgi:hypothetical protein